MRDVFLVEDERRTALFVPRKGLIIEVNEDEKERVAMLTTQPQFSFGDLTEIFPEIDEDRLLSQGVEEQTTAEKETFCPNSAVLFPTFDCSLRCIYCYANAGVQKVNMDHEVARITIDFIVGNAKAKGQEECTLDFHGGGEPTWNWPIFTYALSYFQEQARLSGLTPKVGLATNGMLSRKQVNWIAERVKALQVSLDGMEDIQDFQRPTSGGGRSFEVVCRTVESFLARRIEVVVHSVVTERGVTRIPEIVRFLANCFPGVKAIHLEPASPCGRGLLTNQRFPSPELFSQGFIEAEQIIEPFGIELFYSGASSRLTEYRRSFCGVTVPNFVVTPTGLVTACHEVAEINHPLAKHFIYGYLDLTSKRFVFDYGKIKTLRSFTQLVEADPACQECFARFCCAGDCLAKTLNHNGKRGAATLNPRCGINQDITRHHVLNQF